jgi:hypothetical protein
MSVRTRSQTRILGAAPSYERVALQGYERSGEKKEAKATRKRTSESSAVSTRRAQTAAAGRNINKLPAAANEPLNKHLFGEIIVFLNPADNSVQPQVEPLTIKRIADEKVVQSFIRSFAFLTMNRNVSFAGASYNTLLVLKTPILNTKDPKKGFVTIGYVVANWFSGDVLKIYSMASSVPGGEAVLRNFLESVKGFRLEKADTNLPSEPKVSVAVPAVTAGRGVFLIDVRVRTTEKDPVGKPGVFVTEIDQASKQVNATGLYDPNQLSVDLEAVANNNICGGDVVGSYVSRQIVKNPIKIVLLWPLNNIGPLVPIGFVLAGVDHKNPDSLYIDIICSTISGGGMLLMNFMIDHATHFRKNISLSSLPTVLRYYPKFDFKHRNNCAPGSEIITLPDEFVPPVDITQAYENESVRNVLIKLTEKQLSSHDKCKGKNPSYYSVQPKKFVEDECADDGFYMMRCLNDLPASRR